MKTETTQHTVRPASNDGAALSVHIHPAYFGYAVYHENQQRFLHFDTLINHDAHEEARPVINSDAVSEWFETHKKVFNDVYRTSRICVSTPFFQLLNDPVLSTPANFAIVNKFEDGQLELLTDRIRDDLYVQFGIPAKLYKLIASHFESDNIHFGDRGLLQLLSLESDLIKDGVYCQLLGQDATVLVIKESRLIFFNKYQVKNREDLLYYILLCFQSHDLEPEKDTLLLSGLIEEKAPMYELVFDYIRNVEWMGLPGATSLPEGLPEGTRLHYYINLLSIR